MQRIKTFKEYKQWVFKNKNFKLNFNILEYDTYVYRITNIIENKHYYGSRTTKNKYSKILEEDLKQYKYSSADIDFKNDQKNNPQNYKYKIIKIFNNIGDCMLYESFLHQSIDVSKNENFYNKVSARINHFIVYWQNRPEEELKLIKAKISKSVKKTMSEFSEDRKKEMYRKAHINRDHVKAGKAISLGHSKRTLEDKKLQQKKSFETFQEKYGEDIKCPMDIPEVKKKHSISMKYTIHNKSKEEKNKISDAISIRQQGSKNSGALKLLIFDNNDTLLHFCNGNFFKLCKEMGYPVEKLRKTAKELTKVNYPFKDGALTQAIKRGKDKFIGWYAREVEYVQI